MDDRLDAVGMSLFRGSKPLTGAEAAAGAEAEAAEPLLLPVSAAPVLLRDG